MIEFKLDGTIVTANDNFLKTLGYTLEEIKGQHHRMFCEPAYASSAGVSASSGTSSIAASTRPAEYKRIGKGGKEIWIQASYNPIFDRNGKPYKVVKYATDITAAEAAERRLRRPAGGHRQVAGGDRVQDGRHDRHAPTTTSSNALGYTLRRGPRPASPHVLRPGVYAQAASTRRSGLPSIGASTRRPSTSESARAARRSGFKPPTTRSSTSTASRSRSCKYASDITEQKLGCRTHWLAPRRSPRTRNRKSTKVSNVLSAVANGDLTQHYDVAAADDDTAKCSRHLHQDRRGGQRDVPEPARGVHRPDPQRGPVGQHLDRSSPPPPRNSPAVPKRPTPSRPRSPRPLKRCRPTCATWPRRPSR